MFVGDLASAYSDVVLPAVLIGCRSEDETLRASSLANLGELCKLLKYAMGNHVEEVSISSRLSFDFLESFMFQSCLL